MAIFNSIALMSVRGSIGNLTMTKLKGQNVAKSKAQPTKKPPTLDQLLAQTRLANIVKAWQSIHPFMGHTLPLRRPKETKYNAFVRVFCNYMATFPRSDGWSALMEIVGVIALTGNFIRTGSPTITSTHFTVDIYSVGLPFVPNSFLAALKYRYNNNTQIEVHHLITQAEWNAGTITISLPIAAGNILTAHYIYNYKLKKCSNPFFQYFVA